MNPINPAHALVNFVCFSCLIISLGWSNAGNTTEFAFVDVTVVSMTAPTAEPHQTVLVRDGKITAVGTTNTVLVPADAQRIDGRGRYLMPGLADMHAHVGSGYAPAQRGERAELLMYLTSGVTTLRNAVGSPEVLALADAIERGELSGPRIHSASPLLEGEDAVWDFAQKILTADEAHRTVREIAQQGYEFIKIYHTLSLPVYEAVIDEARRQRIRVFGHVPFEVGVERVLTDQLASIEHFRGYDIDGLSLEALAVDGGRSAQRFASWLNMSDERMDELVRATVAAGTWNCPTFVVSSMLIEADNLAHYASHPMATYMPGDFIERYEQSGLDALFSAAARVAMKRSRPQQYKLVRKLHQAGGRLLAGTDTFPSLVPGFTLIEELVAFVEAGLTPFQALQAATTGPAEFLGSANTQGQVRPGMRADLILLRANPLENVTNLWQLEGVLINGRWTMHSELLNTLKAMSQANAE